MLTEQAAEYDPHVQVGSGFHDVNLFTRRQPLIPDCIDRSILDHSYH